MEISRQKIEVPRNLLKMVDFLKNAMGLVVYIYRERESVFLGRFDVFLEDLIWETLMPVLVFLGGAKLGHNENEASIYIP